MKALRLGESAKENNAAKNFVEATIVRLLQSVQLFSELYLDKPKQLMEFAKEMRVMHVANGMPIPSRKRGMFILLDGKIKLKTHWQLKEGLGLAQK